jgi:hypothetical protein
MPRTEDEVATPVLLLYVVLNLVTGVMNSLSYKRMLNSFKSQDPASPHNYEFFVNQVNVFMYFVVAYFIIIYKRFVPDNGPHWHSKQKFYGVQFTMMGFLDSFAGFLSCVGGAYVGGAVQSLINQTTIPLTLMLSKCFLNATYSKLQNLGAVIILAGACVSVLPSLLSKKDDDDSSMPHSSELHDLSDEPHQHRSLAESVRSATTMVGVVTYLLSIVPGAFSNIYKEWAFKAAENSVDIYYMTAYVSFFQVATGFLFMPLQNLPALGGVPWSDLWQQMIDGNKCMWGYNPREGDECESAGVIMLWYVIINFLYNIFSLLVVKHGSANLSVITAAIALPLTNMSFSWRLVMGPDYEPFDNINLVATAIVLFGFIMYSKGDDSNVHADPNVDGGQLSPKSAARKVSMLAKKGKVLGLASAGGSVMYMRNRSDSDPTTPGYTPMYAKRSGRGVKASPAFNSYGSGYGSGYGNNYGSVGISIGENVPVFADGAVTGETFEPSSV